MSYLDMGFLRSAWNWVCRTTKRVYSYLTGLWDWVKGAVQQAWHLLSQKSISYQECYALKLFATRIRERSDELRRGLSWDDRNELDYLVSAIDDL